MFANFYIPRLSTDMKIAVQKNHLGVKFCTECLTLPKKGSEIKKRKSRNFGTRIKYRKKFLAKKK